MNVIRRAMETLPGHWYQGHLSDEDGVNYCGIGHVLNAEIELGIRGSKGISLMNQIAKEQYPDRINKDTIMAKFAQFNDHPDTTEDEVLMVMEKAAIRLEEQEGLND